MAHAAARARPEAGARPAAARDSGVRPAGYSPAVDALSYALCFAGFLAFHAYLHRRAERAGQNPQIQWRWLAAIAAAVLVVILADVAG